MKSKQFQSIIDNYSLTSIKQHDLPYSSRSAKLPQIPIINQPLNPQTLRTNTPSKFRKNINVFKNQMRSISMSQLNNNNNLSVSRQLTRSNLSEVRLNNNSRSVEQQSEISGINLLKKQWISSNSYLTFLQNLNKIDFLQNHGSCYSMFKSEATKSLQNGRQIWLIDYSQMFDFFSEAFKMFDFILYLDKAKNYSFFTNPLNKIPFNQLTWKMCKNPDKMFTYHEAFGCFKEWIRSRDHYLIYHEHDFKKEEKVISIQQLFSYNRITGLLGRIKTKVHIKVQFANNLIFGDISNSNKVFQNFMTKTIFRKCINVHTSRISIT